MFEKFFGKRRTSKSEVNKKEEATKDQEKSREDLRRENIRPGFPNVAGRGGRWRSESGTSKPQSVTHNNKEYRCQADGTYRDEGGDVLPAVVLAAVLLESHSAGGHGDTEQAPLKPDGGEFGGAGATGTFDNMDTDTSSSSESSSSE